MPEIPRSWLEHIAESTESALLIIDTEHVIRFANGVAAGFFDRKAVGELISRNYGDLLAESIILDELGAVISREQLPSFRSLETGETMRNAQFERIYKGEHLWMSVSATPIVEAGRATHTVIYFLDISQRKKREDQLRFLVESAKILSITTDFKTRLTQKARLTVPSLADWCTVNTVNEDGTLSRITIVHRDPAQVPLVAELAERSADLGGGVSGMVEVVQTGKAQLHASVEAAQYTDPAMRELARKLQVCSSIIVPILSRGKVLGILSLAYAESGRHYTQADLNFMQEFCFHLGVLVDNARLYEEIQKRDAAKDAFLAALSHELRNPLAPIKSALELLQIQNPSDQSLQTLGVVEHQFDHLTKLLNDLLDVTRYSRGNIHIERRRFDLRDVVRHCADVSKPHLEHKRISLETMLPPQSVEILADQTRLEQAVLNILHNAEKFTPARGRVTIKLEHAAHEATISIRDSGQGLDAHELAHLFELGGLIEHKPRNGAGLGIGLVLVKEIMSLHGGTIEARSEGPGLGSEFILTFPLSEAESA